MSSNNHFGTRGFQYDMSKHIRPVNTTTYPPSPKQAMNGINIEAGFDGVTAGWDNMINYRLGADIVPTQNDQPDVGEDGNNNEESADENDLAANNSAEPRTNNQGSAAGQLDTTFNMNRVDSFELDDQTASNSDLARGETVAATDGEWDSIPGSFDEEIVESLTKNTPEDSSSDNTGEQPRFANGGFLAQGENNLLYNGEITADGAVEPYHVKAGLTRLADRERTTSSSSTMSSHEDVNESNLMAYRRPLSDGTHLPNPNRFQGHDRVVFNDSYQQGFTDRNRRGRDMHAAYYPLPASQQMYGSYGQPVNAISRGESQHGNGFGGPALVRQAIPRDDDDLLPLNHGPPSANGFDGWPMHRQGYFRQDYPIGPNAVVNPNGVVEGAPIVDNDNNAYRPLFLTETEFKNRNAGREAARAQSDYPHNDLPRQQHIISLLYNAIKNTTDVEDSEKVAAKFEDGSIPDRLIQETCWEIMIRCRESQELGLLAPECQNVKHLTKESFMARVMSAIATLTRSKAACRQAMAPSFLDRLADQPDEEIKRKCSNKRLNAVKTGQNKAGVQAIINECADKNGQWKGPVVDPTPGVSAPQVEAAIPVEARESTSARHRLDDGSEAGPARKRARR